MNINKVVKKVSDSINIVCSCVEIKDGSKNYSMEVRSELGIKETISGIKDKDVANREYIRLRDKWLKLSGTDSQSSGGEMYL